jgi:hypothetical protein
MKIICVFLNPALFYPYLGNQENDFFVVYQSGLRVHHGLHHGLSSLSACPDFCFDISGPFFHHYDFEPSSPPGPHLCVDACAYRRFVICACVSPYSWIDPDVVYASSLGFDS